VTAVEIVSLAALIGWLWVSFDRSRSWPHEAVLPDRPTGSTAAATDSLVVIVPARNEADLLPETLTSLLRQQIDCATIYLVDDGSNDRTLEVAESLARESTGGIGLEVVHTHPRPTGRAGKVQALERGYAAMLDDVKKGEIGLPEWLLLTDADIQHRAGSLSSLLLQAEKRGSEVGWDLVSVMARLRAENFWERVVVPTFVFFFQLLYPFRRVAQPGSRVAAAAGGCVLVRRSFLEQIGGFSAIRDAIIDDVALAKTVKAAGGRTWLGFDPGICSLRSYPRLGDLWEMVSRTAFDQLHYSAFLLSLTLGALAVFVVSPPLIVAWTLFDGRLGLDGEGASYLRAMSWALGTWILMSVALLPSVRYHRVPAIYACSLPLGGLLFGLMTVSSAWRHWSGKGVKWRGRRVK
jgi:hopene-associated glycosyltransferase HpnB